MPGRTPAEAYRAFIEPIQAAIACLGPAKITTTPGGRGATNPKVYAWSLNEGLGITQGSLRVKFAMKYTFVRRDDQPTDQRWKVSTRSYMYQIFDGEIPALDYHWHPDSQLAKPRSIAAQPHYHAQRGMITDDGVFTSRSHLPTGRMTVEQIVRLLIEENGWPPQVDDWDERLALSEGLFRLYATWQNGA